MSIQTINLNNKKINLLNISENLPQKLMKVNLTIKEFEIYNEMKSEISKSHYLRSRWLMHEIYKKKHDFINDKDGQIIWPIGFIGSLSHKDGNVIFFLNKKSKNLKSIGIDIEKIKKHKSNIWKYISKEKEIYILKEKYNTLDMMYLAPTLMFSAKESLYKCLFPIFGKMYFKNFNLIYINLEKQFLKIKLDKKINKFIKVPSFFEVYFKILDCYKSKMIVTSVYLV